MTNSQMKIVAKDAEMAVLNPKILCVDDEEYNLEIMQKHLNKVGYETIGADDGNVALDILDKSYEEIDVVLLDRMMPLIDGMEVLRKMKLDDRFKDIPVVMQTAAVAAHESVEGIDAGAYYYVTKPYSAEMLISVVSAAIREHKEFLRLKKSLNKSNSVTNIMISGEYQVRTFEDARKLSVFLSVFAKKPSKVVMGLTALIVNAIEHGNLGIGHEKKTELLIMDKWDEEIQRRMSDPTNAKKAVTVSFKRYSDEVIVDIKDEGDGFNWKEYMDFDPKRMTEPNGRGIAMAYSMNPESFKYVGSGNRVIYTIYT